MNEGNLFKEAAQAALVMAAAALLFLGSLGYLGFSFSEKAFHGEGDALSAASAPSKEGKATAKKPPREAKPN